MSKYSVSYESRTHNITRNGCEKSAVTSTIWQASYLQFLLTRSQYLKYKKLNLEKITKWGYEFSSSLQILKINIL
jgi:hypothetical protein